MIYHGSSVGGLKVIEAKSTELMPGKRVVFGTDSKVTAIAMGVRWSDAEIGFEQHGDTFTLTETQPGNIEKIFAGKKVFVYGLSPEGFIQNDVIAGFEYYNGNPCEVLSVEVVDDALKALREQGVVIKNDTPTKTLQKVLDNMDKRTYFVNALKAGAYKHKAWVLSVFSVTRPQTDDNQPTHPGQLYPDPKSKTAYWNVREGDTLQPIEGTSATEPIYRFKEPLSLKAGDLPNLKADVETTYGRALFNAMCLVWPFGDKVEYQNGPVNGKKLDALIANRLHDIPADGQPRNPKHLYVDEFLKYTEAMSALAGFASIAAPAASPKTMTVDPAVIKRRDELFEQYKDQLHDKAIVARIEKELVDMDIASFKGDPSEDFYIKAKTFNVARKRCFVDFGVESGFGESSKQTTIKASLREGIDINEMPSMVDTLRAGSYNRGAETALGGESVKYFYRVFQNTRVAEEDCGTRGGLEWVITEANKSEFIGRAVVEGPKAITLTEENIKGYMGRKILIRSPMLCKTEGASFCARCVGETLARAPTGLHIAASNVGSAFMGASMSAMHGRALETKPFDVKQLIS